MLKRTLTKRSWCQLQKRYVQKDAHVSTSNQEHDQAKIRNIGILAHIDAGKTTTTERMLFYSGLIQNMGEVHHGNTVTDYMEQERERGITITSAAVTFDWKKHRINLIDTPGHIDFTMEVEQTLRVLDGAVVILDGTAGVEAQTLTVCRQADKYNIPRIIYVNKMDRPDANFEASLKSIKAKLNIDPLPTQFPIKKGAALEGIVDVVTLEKLIFDTKKQGMMYTKSKLSEKEDTKLWEMAIEKRRELTDNLSSVDDKLADQIIEQNSLDDVSAQTLVDSLSRATLRRKGIPVLLGSSYKNIGVQPLMDSIILYLPSPNLVTNRSFYKSFNNDLCARVFKIVHDKRKGPVTFFRIYTGSMKKGDKLYNAHTRQYEQGNRLYIPCADDYEEISEIGPGNIAAMAGLKRTVTGDLITSTPGALEKAKDNLTNEKHVTPEEIENFFHSNRKLLQPVFFCSIESPSLSMQNALETALRELEREDPSLKVDYDSEMGQTILSGMGELHIEVVKERIKSDYKIDADLGPLQISYKEAILNEATDTYNYEHTIGTKVQKVSLTMSLIPNPKKDQLLILDRSKECKHNISMIHPKTLQDVVKGIKSAFLHGPKLGSPVINVAAKLHNLEVGRETSGHVVTAAVSQCIRKLLIDASVTLMEPIMNVEIVTLEEYSSNVLGDLAKRRAEIKKIDVRGQNKIFEVMAPLSELMGYSTTLRIITSGHATFSLELSHYRLMEPTEEAETIRRITGFIPTGPKVMRDTEG